MVSLRNIVKSVATVLPEIPKPIKKPSLSEKFIWTGGALIIYMIMGITPLFHFGNQQRPVRVPQGHLRLLAGDAHRARDRPDRDGRADPPAPAGERHPQDGPRGPDDRALFGTATKLLTFVVIAVESGAYILGGALGTLQSTQAIVMFEALRGERHHPPPGRDDPEGVGNRERISLFILGGVAQILWWDSFSPYPVSPTQGAPTMIDGFIPALVNSLFAGGRRGRLSLHPYRPVPERLHLRDDHRGHTLHHIHRGDQLPSAHHLGEVQRVPGRRPFKLLYVSNIPVILVSALTANISFFTRLLHNYIGATPPSWMPYLVTYDTNYNPTGGIVYDLTPPNGISQTAANPLHAVIYCVFLMTFAVMFARIWVEIGGPLPGRSPRTS